MKKNIVWTLAFLLAVTVAASAQEDTTQDVLAAQKMRLKQRLADLQASEHTDPALLRALMEDAVRDLAGADRCLLTRKVSDEQMEAHRQKLHMRKLAAQQQAEAEQKVVKHSV
jgi:ABC-type transporter MlaC component